MLWGLAGLLTVGLWLHHRTMGVKSSFLGSGDAPSEADVRRAQAEAARAAERARRLYERWRGPR